MRRCRHAPVRLAVVLAVAVTGFGLGCASTDSPRDFVNRLATPNEGVRAGLAQLEERVQELEGMLAESESENVLLQERIAEVETALEEVRALASAPAPPVPFDPPPPARVQILEVTELEDVPGNAPRVQPSAAAEAAAPGAGDRASEAAPNGANVARAGSAARAGPGAGAGDASVTVPNDASGANAARARPGASDEASVTDGLQEPARVGLRRAAGPAAAEEAAQELYDRAREQVLNREYVEAEVLFQRFLDAFPDSDLSDNALYWIGECRLARGDNRGAMVAFETMLQEYPHGNKVPDALFKTGRTLERLGDTEGARRRFQEVLQRFGDSEAARLAAASLSQLEDEG